VDLAGSEKRVGGAGTGTQEEINKGAEESRAINKSLTALGDVICALSPEKPGAFIPYRNHPLTQLMSDSLGGNAKTLMVVNVSPAERDVTETVSSLEYAMRANRIVNKENKKCIETNQIKSLKHQIDQLKQELHAPKAVKMTRKAKTPTKFAKLTTPNKKATPKTKTTPGKALQRTAAVQHSQSALSSLTGN
jgi:hypothetical protein